MPSNHRDIANLLRSLMDVGSSHIEHVHAEPRKRPSLESVESPSTPREGSIFERIRGKLALRQTINLDDKVEG